jgi:hypothetical protein
MSSSQSAGVKLFYSYAREDSTLRAELEKHLSILKRSGVIESWSDQDITAGTDWENTIAANLDSADIILLLISADFIASDYCYNNELNQAMLKHERGEAVVIPVILRPVDWTGCLFHKLQALPANGLPVTHWATPDDAFANISQGIRKAAKEIMERRRALLDATPKAAVYLAETDSDQKMQGYRQKVAAQLAAEGYRILPPPDTDLPDESPDYENEVRKYLQEAKLSVHLIGSKYGRGVIGRNDMSAVELQNALAEERRKQGGFESLIWIPPEAVPATPRQQAFHKYLETEPEAQRNAEVSRRGFQSFKERVVEKLKKEEPLKPGPVKTIYLMCEQRDQQSVRVVKDILFNKGFEVFLPPGLDGMGPGVASHEKWLKSCDATLIYYGATHEDWVSIMIFDLIHAPKLRESGDFLCKALFLADPQVEYRTHAAEILKHDGNSVESSLRPFIECLQSKGARGGER